MTAQLNLVNRRMAAMGAILALFAAIVAFSAAPSTAEAGLPAICAEYPDLPKCDEDPGGGGDGNDFCDLNPDAPRCEGVEPVPGGGGNGPSADPGSTNGSLPFTGYPLTPLLLLMLILLLIGLTIRAYLAIRDRVRGDNHATVP